MKLVSVVVLAYRSADTIIETLESIKKQTYPQIELIVTDDCSPDNTVEVVESWMRDNKGCLSDMKLVTTKKNTGLPSNINRGLQAATGMYYKGIAGDDYLTEDAIEKYVDFCEENPGVFPIARVHLFTEHDNNPSFPEIQAYCNKCYDFAQKTYKEQYQMLLMQNRIVAPSATFYTIDFLKQVKGYDEEYKWFEDYPMNLKVMHAGYKFGLIDEEIVWYRMSEKSVTASQQMRLKKTEMKLFFRRKLWYMIQAGMGWEGIKQFKYWLKIAMTK